MNNNTNNTNRLPNGQFAAPELIYKGNKTQNNDTNQSYLLPQKLCDILFNELGNKSAQLRIMMVLCGTKTGFFVSEKWILDRTGLLHQNYIRARKELEDKGWLICKAHKSITVNFDAIYASEATEEEIEEPVVPPKEEKEEEVVVLPPKQQQEVVPPTNTAETIFPTSFDLNQYEVLYTDNQDWRHVTTATYNEMKKRFKPGCIFEETGTTHFSIYLQKEDKYIQYFYE